MIFATAEFQAPNFKCLTRLHSIDVINAGRQTAHVLSDVITASPLLKLIHVHGDINELLGPAFIDALETFGRIHEAKAGYVEERSTRPPGRAERQLELSLDVNMQGPFNDMDEAELTKLAQENIQALLPVCDRQGILQIHITPHFST